MNLEKYRQIFFDETSQDLNSLETLILKTEQVSSDIDAINSIFRMFHRLKSSSAMMGLNNFSELSHHAEDLLSIIKEGEIVAEPQVISILLSVIDAMRRLITMAESGDMEGFKPDGLLSELQNICNEAKINFTAPAESELPCQKEESKVTNNDISVTQPHHGLNIIRIDESELNDLIDMAGELISTVSELDKVINIVNGLSSFKEIQMINHSLNFIKRKADKLSLNIHNRLLGSKMVQAGEVFERLKRVIHDLSLKTGKCTQVIINGAEIELDRGIVDKLFNPLLHLVRNAIDHGIENDEERIRNGKTQISTITISALLEGHFVIIAVEDDGKGIDCTGVKREIVKKGLLDQDLIGKLTEKEILDYLFIPGFSTKEEATDLSGRGMGLDIVKENVKELKGDVEINTIAKKGTTVKITIPQTLSIIRCLQVFIGNGAYSIPSEAIMEIIPFMSEAFMSVNGKPLLLYRGSPVPIADLQEALNIKNDNKSISSHIIIGSGDIRVSIPVNNIIGEQDILIKHLGQSFSKVVGILGVGILAGGRLSLIMDTDFVLKQYTLKGDLNDRVQTP